MSPTQATKKPVDERVYEVGELTRVEGEGSLRLRVRDGEVVEARLGIFETGHGGGTGGVRHIGIEFEETFGGFREQEKKIAEYRRRIKYCDPVGSFVNEQVNTVNFLMCHEDNTYGGKTGQRLAGTFNYMAEQLLAARHNPPRHQPNSRPTCSPRPLSTPPKAQRSVS